MMARGEILAFLDDDAYPADGWLEAAMARFEDPTVCAVGGPGVTPQVRAGATFNPIIITRPMARTVIGPIQGSHRVPLDDESGVARGEYGARPVADAFRGFWGGPRDSAWFLHPIL
jgi:hypothetical protein